LTSCDSGPPDAGSVLASHHSPVRTGNIEQPLIP
jgi:hypothetical protein